MISDNSMKKRSVHECKKVEKMRMYVSVKSGEREKRVCRSIRLSRPAKRGNY